MHVLEGSHLTTSDGAPIFQLINLRAVHLGTYSRRECVLKAVRACRAIVMECDV
jgi:hypothetical protein